MKISFSLVALLANCSVQAVHLAISADREDYLLMQMRNQLKLGK